MPTIKTAYLDDMLFESQCGDHRILIDVPPAMGGANRGPTPPELFIASLGSCIGAFAATYCHQTGIDTREMSVDVSFEKVDNPTRLTNLKITVNLPHGDCARRQQALKRVAEHCPVHETITTLDGIEIEFQGQEAAVPV